MLTPKRLSFVTASNEINWIKVRDFGAPFHVGFPEESETVAFCLALFLIFATPVGCNCRLPDVDVIMDMLTIGRISGLTHLAPGIRLNPFGFSSLPNAVCW